MKVIKWTEEEDRILVQAVKANPHNKAQAFKEVAKKVNHSFNSCSSRWYRISEYEKKNLSIKEEVTITNCCAKPIKRSLWSKIKHLFVRAFNI